MDYGKNKKKTGRGKKRGRREIKQEMQGDKEGDRSDSVLQPGLNTNALSVDTHYLLTWTSTVLITTISEDTPGFHLDTHEPRAKDSLFANTLTLRDAHPLGRRVSDCITTFTLQHWGHSSSRQVGERR